jgi:hypothetical protein
MRLGGPSHINVSGLLTTSFPCGPTRNIPPTAFPAQYLKFNTVIDRLPKWKAKIESVFRGDSNARVIVCDDSTGRGHSSSFHPNNQLSGSWPTLMAASLRALGYPVYSSFALPSSPTVVRDDRFTVGGSAFAAGLGGWANFSGGLSSACHQQTTVNTPVRFTPGESAGECDTVDLYWIRLNTGNIDYNINGGAWQQITTTGSGDIQKTTINIGSSATTHYIEYRHGTADCYVVGVDFYHSTKKRILVMNLSVPAAKLNIYTNLANNWSGNALIDAIRPDLVIAGDGINPFFQSNESTATVLGYHTTFRTQLAAMSADIEYLMKTPVPSSESAKAGIVAAQLDIVEGYRNYAQTNNLGFIDLYNEFGGAYQPGLMNDTLHPNDAGYARMEEIMRQALQI